MPEVLIVGPILSLVDCADGGWPTVPAFSLDECAKWIIPIQYVNA
jgi:hypothetical protein